LSNCSSSSPATLSNALAGAYFFSLVIFS